MYTHSSIHLSIMYICVYITLHRSAAGTVLPSRSTDHTKSCWPTASSCSDLSHRTRCTGDVIPLASFPSRSFVSDQLHCSDFPPGQCSALPCCIAINIALGIAHPWSVIPDQILLPLVLSPGRSAFISHIDLRAVRLGGGAALLLAHLSLTWPFLASCFLCRWVWLER